MKIKLTNFKAPKNTKMGRFILNSMNISHRSIYRMCLKHTPFSGEERKIIDIGCGGGRMIHTLLKKYPQATVYGIDISDASVSKSLDYNKQAVSEGRCIVTMGNANCLPYEDEFFDLITATETVMFWDPIDDSLREVLRCMKQGAYFVIGIEAGSKKQSRFWSKIVEGMHPYDAEFMEQHLKDVGFSDVKVFRKNMYACLVSRKLYRN